MTANIEKLEKELAQTKAKLADAKARQRAEKRKLNTRVKIIIGGALLSAPGHEDSIRDLVQRVTREADRKVLAKAGLIQQTHREMRE